MVNGQPALVNSTRTLWVSLIMSASDIIQVGPLLLLVHMSAFEVMQSSAGLVRPVFQEYLLSASGEQLVKAECPVMCAHVGAGQRTGGLFE